MKIRRKTGSTETERKKKSGGWTDKIVQLSRHRRLSEKVKATRRSGSVKGVKDMIGSQWLKSKTLD